MDNVLLAVGLTFLLFGQTKGQHDPICGDACLTLATNFNYYGCSATDDLYYACRCVSPEFLGTMALCIDNNNCNRDIWDWVDKVICQGYGEIVAPIPPFQTVLANATRFQGPPPTNATNPVSYPLIFPEDIFVVSYETSNAFTGNLTYGSFFGWLLCMFAGLLCLVGAVTNHILPLLLRRQSYDIEGTSSWQPNKFLTYIKRHFLLPATFGTAHVRRRFFLSIPLRSQTILISLYLMINLIFMCVDYDVFEANLYWPGQENVQLSRYLADRSGILAFAQIPLLIAFAGRNNILIWLTGWSFSTFNVFHKWVARVCLIHTFVHSVTYTVYGVLEGESLSVYYEDAYLRWGVVGTLACCLLCFQAMYIFRKSWYEIFLAMHIVLAIIFMIGTWYHVSLLDSGHMEWLYAAVAIWAFDRVLRIVRLVLLNVSWVKGRTVRTASLQMVGPGAIKAQVKVGYNFTFRPGQYAFFYFPRFNFWESHPFTLALYHISKDHGQPTVTLLFRTRSGITRKLQKYLEGVPKELSCFMEGPYGHYRSVENYDTVLLLAGGVGITAVFAYLRYLAVLNTNKVRFVWIVRDEDSTKWFQNEIAELVGKENIDIEIHITKSGTGKVETARESIAEGLAAASEEVESLKVPEVKVNTVPRYIIVGHKPSLTEVISQQCLEGGSLAVLACGPPTFVDETRGAVAENVTKAKGVVDYFEETFGW